MRAWLAPPTALSADWLVLFFFNDTATTEIYTLSLHDALPIPGHWEGDLLAGSSNSQIATLVERQSRFVILVAVGRKDTRSVIAALSRQVARLPQQLRASLTWDRGLEMAEHAKFTVATDVKVYFCDPRS